MKEPACKSADGLPLLLKADTVAVRREATNNVRRTRGKAKLKDILTRRRNGECDFFLTFREAAG